MTNPAIWRALNHAFDTHVGEYRKVVRIPYLIHPLRVASILCSFGFPDDLTEIIIYPDTDHGFYADYRPSYHKENAAIAWKRMLDWFKKNGVA